MTERDFYTQGKTSYSLIVTARKRHRHPSEHDSVFIFISEHNNSEKEISIKKGRINEISGREWTWSRRQGKPLKCRQQDNRTGQLNMKVQIFRGWSSLVQAGGSHHVLMYYVG